MNFRRKRPKVRSFLHWGTPKRVKISLVKNDIPETVKYDSNKKSKFCKKLKGKHVAGEWEFERKTPWCLYKIKKCTGCGKILKYDFPSLNLFLQNKKSGQGSNATDI